MYKIYLITLGESDPLFVGGTRLVGGPVDLSRCRLSKLFVVTGSGTWQEEL